MTTFKGDAATKVSLPAKRKPRQIASWVLAGFAPLLSGGATRLVPDACFAQLVVVAVDWLAPLIEATRRRLSQ